MYVYVYKVSDFTFFTLRFAWKLRHLGKLIRYTRKVLKFGASEGVRR
jgi:hypothetical protein